MVERRKIPSVNTQDENYRRLRYVRYADDFLLGFTGSKADAEEIKAEIGRFLKEKLNLIMSEEKTLITNAGSQAAKFLGYDFVDTDLVIQEKTGKLLHELITEYGLDGFKKIEEDIIAGISCQKSVIAPGGSVIYGEKAMKHLKEIGKVVYLKISYEELEGRLGNLQSRGVALKEGQPLLDLYHERVPYYDKYADITIEEQGL